MSMELLAEKRNLPVEYLQQMGVTHLFENVYEIAYPNRTGTWYTRLHRMDTREKKYESDTDQPPRLYNPALIVPRPGIDIWVCEGEWDALTLNYVGVNAVGLGGGTNHNDSWSALYGRARRTVVAVDNDAAGDKWWLEHAVKWSRPVRFEIPLEVNGELTGWKDVNDWHVADSDGLAAAVLAR